MICEVHESCHYMHMIHQVNFLFFREDDTICYSMLCKTNVFDTLQKIQQILNSYSAHLGRNICDGRIPDCSVGGDLSNPQNASLTTGQVAVKGEFPPPMVPDLLSTDVKDTIDLNIVTGKTDDGMMTPTSNVLQEEKKSGESTERTAKSHRKLGAENQEDTKVEGVNDTTGATNTDGNLKNGIQADNNTNEDEELNMSKAYGKCSRCNMEFPSQKEYDKHYYRVHRKSALRSKKGQKLSVKLKRHADRDAGIAKKQPITKKSKHELYKRRIKRSKPVSEYVCTVCGFKCSWEYLLHRHMFKEHKQLEEGVKHCETCQLTFTKKGAFEKHMERHENPQEMSEPICTVCGVRCSHEHALHRHMFREHNQVEEGLQHCETCQLTFQKKGSYEKHMERHRNSGFKCKKCVETFSDLKSLYRHQFQTHIKTYRCQKCPVVMKSSLELKVCQC